MMELVLWWER